MNEKKKKKGLPKRILSFVLTLALVFTLMPGMSMEVKAAEHPDWPTEVHTTCSHTGATHVYLSGNTYTYTLTINGSSGTGVELRRFSGGAVEDLDADNHNSFLIEDFFPEGASGWYYFDMTTFGFLSCVEEPEGTPEPTPAPAPDMATTNIGGLAYNTWEDIVANIPALTVEKLHEVNNNNEDLLHVNIYGKVDKIIPAEAIEALDKSPIRGLHVFVGESDAITFLNEYDYTNYTSMSFKHEDVIEENSRVIDFTTKGKINATVMFHTLIAPNVKAKVYKVVDGKEVEIATLSSNENGGFCFLIDELAKYVIKY